MAPSPPDLVLLDAFGTLVAMDPPGPILHAELARAGYPIDEQVVQRALEREIAHYRSRMHIARDRTGLAALRAECGQVLCEALGPGAPPVPEATAMLVASLRFRLHDDAPGAMDALEAHGVRLGVVSNWDCALPDHLAALGVEHLIVGSAKLAGPVGISVVTSAPGRQLRPIVVGGGQERGRRGGTEAVLLADALALALRLAQEEAPRRCPAVRAIADRFDATLGDPLALGLQPTGPREARDRLCGHRSFAAGWALGDDLVAALDHEGLAASTGSACLSGSREPSEALLACGFDEASARGGLRLSFDAHHVAADAERAAQALRRVGERLRGAVAAR